MSQNSLVLPTSGTVSGLQMTQNTNNALDTLNTLASGASAPASPEAGQLWHDTTNNLLKIRSLDNTSWIPFVALNEGAYSALPYLSGQITGDVNRIINPAMDIDQANEGSSYSIPANNTVTYTVDQWWGECISTAGTPASGITAQRVADAPAGFTHSLKVTVGTGASAVGAGDYLAVVQPIEANNISDLGFGTANAAPVSLSFWVKSSIAGTFAVALGNVSPRQIISTFTVASAGVWQKVVIQNIPGDQAGTWGTGNAVGLLVTFTIAAGSNYQSSTLGSWVGSYLLTSNAPSNGVLTTSGATFQISGVMLNAGVFSLPYEKRTIQQELALCQRYYEKTFMQGTAVAQNAGISGALYMRSQSNSNNTNFSLEWFFKVVKRTTPTLITYNPSAANASFRCPDNSTDYAVGETQIADSHAGMGYTVGSFPAFLRAFIHATANARM